MYLKKRYVDKFLGKIEWNIICEWRLRGDDIDKGGEVSKSCRYDEPDWTDCDPFEMIRYRTLRLISGGRQCEEFKNITKHCTADELPPGMYRVFNYRPD